MNNSPIGEANEAAIRTDIQSIKDKYEIVYKDVLFKNFGDETKITDEDFADVVPEEYKDKIVASKDGLEYIGEDEKVEEIAKDMGLGVEKGNIIEYITAIAKQAGAEIGTVIKEGEEVDEYIYHIREKGTDKWTTYPSTEDKIVIDSLKKM